MFPTRPLSPPARGAASIALGVTFAITLAACGGTSDTASESAPEAPHGYVEGAQEVGEPQVGLAYAERGAQTLAILDLAGEATTTVELDVAAQTIAEDGRFVYVGDGDRTVEVVDTGVWTVDHADHVHYYRAPAASVGTLTLDAPITSVVGQDAHTTVGTADGTVTVLDRRALEAGQLTVAGELRSDAPTPFAVPYRGNLLLAGAAGLTVVAPNGAPVRSVGAACGAPEGWALLRGAVAVGCDEGVFVAKQKAGQDHDVLLPYPAGAERVRAFGYRPRSNEAAAVAGAGAWSVNTSRETLVHVPVPADVVVASSPADGASVVTLDVAGTVRVSATSDGAVRAQTPLVPSGTSTPVLLDTARAYLADPAAEVVYELDYADNLRVARTLTLGARPELIVEVGR